MRMTTILCVAMLVLVTLPGALASHGDPTHGTAPHSVSREPSNIHAVDVSTPHPYPRATTMSWTVEVGDADTLSIHFERYDVNGQSSRRGGCSGSTVLLHDADTGEHLDTVCGNRDDTDAFWTPFYDTNRIQITLDSDHDFSEHYGFDIYEVASDGAAAFYSIPYSSQPRTDSEADGEVEPDPFLPTESLLWLFATAEAEYLTAEAHGTAQAGFGKYVDCNPWFCRERDGNRVQVAGGAGVGTITVDGEVLLFLEEDEEAPGGYTVRPAYSCDVDGTPCPHPDQAP